MVDSLNAAEHIRPTRAFMTSAFPQAHRTICAAFQLSDISRRVLVRRWKQRVLLCIIAVPIGHPFPDLQDPKNREYRTDGCNQNQSRVAQRFVIVDHCGGLAPESAYFRGWIGRTHFWICFEFGCLQNLDAWPSFNALLELA